MLTSFARNIASVLSTTLLSDYQDSPVNQSSSGNLLKRIQDAQPPLEMVTNQSEGSETNASFGRYPRSTRESSSNEGETLFQNPYATNPPRYSKYHESVSSYKPYEFTVNSRIPYNEVNTPGNLNIINTKENSVNEDVNPPPFHSLGFKYKPEPVDPLSNSNHYARLVDLHYHRLSTQRPVDPRQHSTTPEQEINTDENGNNNQIARITRRPYNLNYRGSFHNSYYTPGFQGQPEFYPRERPVESEDRYVTPTNGRDESDPSRLEDQNQGQTALRGYDYGPRFHYGLPPYDAFYHGFPGFYPRPYNDTFHPGYNKETQGDGNGTGPQPYGPPSFYHDPRFGPHQQPFYPNFYEHGRPARPSQNPADNQGNSEQIVTPENGNNATYHGYPPFGYPSPYGPHYGGLNLHGYPLLPFFGGYRFGHGFHDHLFSGIKSVPYLNFYHHFPSVHWHPPYGGHHYDHRPVTTTEKPAEKTVNENSEASASNSEAETLSEIKSSERTRSSPSRGYKKRFSSGFVAKEGSKVAGDRILNRLI